MRYVSYAAALVLGLWLCRVIIEITYAWSEWEAYFRSGGTIW